MDSKKSKFFFRYKQPSGFMIKEFSRLVEIPPIMSIKTEKDITKTTEDVKEIIQDIINIKVNQSACTCTVRSEIKRWRGD